MPLESDKGENEVLYRSIVVEPTREACKNTLFQAMFVKTDMEEGDHKYKELDYKEWRRYSCFAHCEKRKKQDKGTRGMIQLNASCQQL